MLNSSLTLLQFGLLQFKKYGTSSLQYARGVTYYNPSTQYSEYILQLELPPDDPIAELVREYDPTREIVVALPYNGTEEILSGIVGPEDPEANFPVSKTFGDRETILELFQGRNPLITSDP